MPQLIAGWIIGILGITAGSTAAAIVTALVDIVFSVGLYFLSYLLTPKSTTKPSDVTIAFRKAVGARYRHYGRVKVSGQWVFCAAKNGALYKVIALGQGPFNAIEEYWIDGNHVTLDGSGFATTSVTLDGTTSTNYNRKARIISRLGTDTQTYYSQIGDIFPAWDSTHIGKGVASIACIQFPVASKSFSDYFPNSYNTNYRVVATTTSVENPVTSTTAYDDNAAAIIRDYLYSEYGFRLPKSILTTPLAQAGWETAYTKAAAVYNLKAGGTEKRYRIWGSFSLEDRPADILNKMLAACDGRMKITADGGMTLDVGDYVEPTIIFTDDDILGFSEFGHGKDILSTANVIKATFTAPKQDYLEADADEWIDETDVLARGEITSSIELLFSPSHAQTRRLMKINAYRANPEWTGTFEVNLKGLAAISERFIRIQFSPLDLDAVFEINKLAVNVGESNIVKSVSLTVTSITSDAFSWNPATEEGTEPAATDITEDTVIPVPTGFNAVIQRKLVSGSYFPYAYLSWDAAAWESLYVTAQYKKSSDSTWITISTKISDLSVDSPILDDVVYYDFRIAQSTHSGKLSNWTSTISLQAVADVAAPDPITRLTATAGTGQVAFTFTSPNSENYVATNFYRNTVNTESTATLIHTEFGAPSTADSYTNTGLAAGTYYYWLKARNGSNVKSTSVATGAKTVT